MLLSKKIHQSNLAFYMYLNITGVIWIETAFGLDLSELNFIIDVTWPAKIKYQSLCDPL